MTIFDKLFERRRRELHTSEEKSKAYTAPNVKPEDMDDSEFVRYCVERMKMHDIDTDKGKEQVRSIGKELSDRGYVPLMRQAYDLYISEHGDGRNCSLNYVWNGIGYWST